MWKPVGERMEFLTERGMAVLWSLALYKTISSFGIWWLMPVPGVESGMEGTSAGAEVP